MKNFQDVNDNKIQISYLLCNENCPNKMMKIECNEYNCDSVLGECSNRYNQQNPFLRIIKTEGKGY